MTTAEKLAEVTAQIRKDIPRLMELKEGCWIKQKTSEKDFIFKVVAVKDDFLKCVLGFAEFIFLAKDIVNSPKSFEIIGHDIMLNDVLEWLFYTIAKKAVIVFDVDVFGVRAFYPQRDSDRYIDATKRIKIDFFTPYLKDQSEELIKFLYDLKQKIDE